MWTAVALWTAIGLWAAFLALALLGKRFEDTRIDDLEAGLAGVLGRLDRIASEADHNDRMVHHLRTLIENVECRSKENARDLERHEERTDRIVADVGERLFRIQRDLREEARDIVTARSDLYEFIGRHERALRRIGNALASGSDEQRLAEAILRELRGGRGTGEEEPTLWAEMMSEVAP